MIAEGPEQRRNHRENSINAVIFRRRRYYQSEVFRSIDGRRSVPERNKETIVPFASDIFRRQIGHRSASSKPRERRRRRHRGIGREVFSLFDGRRNLVNAVDGGISRDVFRSFEKRISLPEQNKETILALETFDDKLVIDPRRRNAVIAAKYVIARAKFYVPLTVDVSRPVPEQNKETIFLSASEIFLRQIGHRSALSKPRERRRRRYIYIILFSQ